MLTLSKFKSKFYEDNNILDRFNYQDKNIIVFKDFSISIDEEFIDSDVKTLEEAREYIKSYINNSIILSNIDTIIPEDKIVNLINKYHKIDKITDTIVESYLELASSNIFTIDPVLLEIKQRSSLLPGKIEHTLNDNVVVAIDYETQNLLNTLLENKYEIIEYMRESKENFMRIIKEVS